MRKVERREQVRGNMRKKVERGECRWKGELVGGKREGESGEERRSEAR